MERINISAVGEGGEILDSKWVDQDTKA
jgi:hypothetical protein